MEPQNRKQFRDYIMRRLGAPVQEINVDIEQVEDRIDDALNYYFDYHYLGTEKVIFKYKVTREDITNRFISIPENITGINKIYPLAGSTQSSSNALFSAKYHIAYDTLMNMSSNSIIPYYFAMTRLADLSYIFDMDTSIGFNKHKNSLEITAGWGTDIREGMTIVAEGNAILDPQKYKDIWKDRWLKKYATALVKRQWGENTKLFNGVQLLGGISIDGKGIYDEAVEEINKLEDEMLTKYSMPVMDEIA